MFGNSLKIAIRYTLVTTVLLSILYPRVVTGFAQLALRRQADGELITSDGKVIGSRLIGQNFASDKYFHGRVSAAGNGYDATASSGSNYAQSNQKLVTRIQGTLQRPARTIRRSPRPLISLPPPVQGSIRILLPPRQCIRRIVLLRSVS